MSRHGKRVQVEDLLPQLICTPAQIVPQVIVLNSMQKENKQSRASSRRKDDPSCSLNCTNMKKPEKKELECPGICTTDKKNKSSKYNTVEYMDEEKKGCQWLQEQIVRLREKLDILAEDNAVLNSQLPKTSTPKKCRPTPQATCTKPAPYSQEVETRFKEFSKSTNALEKQVQAMEISVINLQEQLNQAKKDREEIDRQRKAAVEVAHQLACLERERQKELEPKLVCRPFCKGSCKTKNDCQCSEKPPDRSLNNLK